MAIVGGGTAFALHPHDLPRPITDMVRSSGMFNLVTPLRRMKDAAHDVKDKAAAADEVYLAGLPAWKRMLVLAKVRPLRFGCHDSRAS